MSSTSDAVTTSTTKPRIIHLKTADDKIFDVEESVAMEFKTVKTFFDDNDGTAQDENTIVPLPNVSARPLSKIISYCKDQVSFAAKSAPEEERNAYSAEFVKELSQDDLKEMILAANYLDIKKLLDLLNQAVADLIQNKSVEFVREFFGIENDFTREEEAMIRNEFAWAFEGVDPV